MTLIDRVAIEPRFQRAIRIDVDLGDPNALRGFVCPPSSVRILRSMAEHVHRTGQAAFTWTGPYGSGKSSLVVALSALLNGNAVLRDEAASIIGRQDAADIWAMMPPRSKGWRVLGIVGRKDDAVSIFGEALEAAGLGAPEGAWTESLVLEALTAAAAKDARARGGLLVVVDEMGKMLEAAARGQGDVHLIQQIAELASRSKGRLVLVGILHQAFDEYAAKLSRDLRDEWTKIHGRFVDLPVNVGGEEQIAILARAIQGEPMNEELRSAAAIVATAISGGKPAEPLSELLASCWPLHPATAALLGPVSRRRFGQNQRSIFGFLNSAEPQGFRDFLRHEDGGAYAPDRLWDYLRLNLEPSILSSPDGHRWAVAVEAIDRCGAISGDELHMALLKTIAVIDLFKDRSGLVASSEVLESCFPDASQEAIAKAISALTAWSLIVHKKFAGSFAVYAGSDFDIEAAIAVEASDHPLPDMAMVRSLSGLQPVLCKRHYHVTGALRWFDVDIVLSSGIIEHSQKYVPAEGTIGQFVLVVPDGGETTDEVVKRLQALGRASSDWDLVHGVASGTDFILALAQEVQALGRVRAHPDLQGDPVARREVAARLASAQTLFEAEVARAFDMVDWYDGRGAPEVRSLKQLSQMASEYADRRFVKSPRLHSELLNRIKPSSNAVAARNALLKNMVTKGSLDRLGIDGFPAEGGLYMSLLARTGLHAMVDGAHVFVDPREGDDVAGLGPLWTAAEKLLRKNSDRSVAVSDIYDLWGGKPFGVKRGVMPVLAIAFMMTMRSSLAFYRDAIFQPSLREIDIDYLVKDASLLQIRWMDLNQDARELLSGLADVVRELDSTNTLADLEPIDVGRGLVAIYSRLSPWSQRTQRLSSKAAAIRAVFKKASDPNKLIFNDLPGLFSVEASTHDAIVASVRDGLEELVASHPGMLHRLRSEMLAELQVPNASPNALADLRARAENIRNLAGDFYLEAFIGRIATFEGTDADIEGLSSLAANKPMRDWSDADIDRAAMGLAGLAQKFNRAEAFAHVKGRKDKREAMALVVSVGGRPEPVFGEFDVGEGDRPVVDQLLRRFQDACAGSDRRHVLAAIARLGAEMLVVDGDGRQEDKREAV